MAKRSSKSNSLEAQLRKFFLPMLVMAALLPLSLMAVVFGFSDQLFPKADEPNTLRVWLEPTAILAKKGQPVTLTVMAALDNSTVIISALNLGVTVDPNVTISPSTVSYSRPLQGQASVGTIQFVPATSGKYILSIPTENVIVGGQNHPAISVSGATVTVSGP